MIRAPRPSARTVSIPAPVGGWNARDPLSNMEPTDAPIMDNAFPTTSGVMLRNGYTKSVTGFPQKVESLMTYNNATASRLFAASGTAFYDSSSTGAVGAAVVSGLTNARWNSINVSTAGGNFLLAVNGFDKLRGYNGTAWYADGDGTHDITGVDSSTCSQIFLFKTRVWLVQSSSLKVWYLPVNSISGAASALDFSAIARKGGHIVAMGSWTLDAGNGVDDYAVFVTSMGEIIVYQGSDPSSATTWALNGVWELGSPVGSRCITKFSGDCLLLTVDGLTPLSKALISSRVKPNIALTDKIRQAVNDATTAYNGNFGWQIQFYPMGNMVILNVPISTTSSYQYVMNTLTGSWCRFTGWDAHCFCVFNDVLYFGGSNYVAKAAFGNTDNGSEIRWDVQQAFNSFGAPGRVKFFKMAKPMFATNGTIGVYTGLNIDYDNTNPQAVLTVSATNSSLWGTAIWGTDVWSAGNSINKNWKTVGGIGYMAALRTQASSIGAMLYWYSTDYVYEVCGIL